MSILSLKRWEPTTYDLGGGVAIRMKLKRLKRHEAKPLTKVLVAVFEQYEKAKAEDLTAAQKAAIIAEVYTSIPEDQLKGWFASCVKDVEDFEVDGERITTGPELLDNADDALLFFVLFRLNALSRLTSGESNASASPSGSLRRLEAAADGSSPAGSTASEAGLQPTTATEIPTSNESSTGPA